MGADMIFKTRSKQSSVDQARSGGSLFLPRDEAITSVERCVTVSGADGRVGGNAS